MRAVKKFAEAVARLLKLALIDESKARAELEHAATSALGMPPGPLVMVDAQSAASVLERPERVLLLALYVEAQASFDTLTGLNSKARSRLTHALELVHLVLDRDPSNAEALAVAERLRLQLG